MICRHGIFRKLIVDGGPENKKLVEALVKRYSIRHVVVSAYHPQANSMVERGYGLVIDALSNMS